MSITTSAVSSITMTNSGTNPWTAFSPTTPATGGNLQANWNDIASQLNSCYMPLLNSAVGEINNLYTTANVTYFVNKTLGSNSNDGLSAGAALETIMAAINKIPKKCDHTMTVTCATGTYAETVSAQGFYGQGSIRVYGGSSIADAANYVITRVDVENNMIAITVRGFLASTNANHGFYAFNCNYAYFYYCVATASDIVNDGMLFYLSNGHAYASYLSNKVYGIESQFSKVYSNINSGSNNTYGLFADYAGEIGKSSDQPAGNTSSEGTARGGRIA